MSEEEKRRCCILGGCGCGPDQQASALSEKLADWSDGLYESDVTFDMARGLLAEFDLVPKGVGSAIMAGYAFMDTADKGDGKG